LAERIGAGKDTDLRISDGRNKVIDLRMRCKLEDRMKTEIDLDYADHRGEKQTGDLVLRMHHKLAERMEVIQNSDFADHRREQQYCACVLGC
jgi:hypothetical protein